MPGYSDRKDTVQKRLRRIEGQGRGVQRMGEEDKYCIDVLDQAAAVTKALQTAASEPLDDPLTHRVADAVAGGDHPAAVARASGFGMVSSSCSYAATAMAKSLFQKGADFISAMVFMFASTNLVIELGVVLVILMGWQFAAAEFIGGPIMIVLLAAFGGFVLRGALVVRARERLQHGMIGGHDHQAMVGVSETRQHELERTPWRVKLTSKAA